MNFSFRSFHSGLLFWFVFFLSTSASAGLPYAWVELGPAGPLVRVATKNKSCPAVQVNGTDRAMSPRITTALDGFDVNVCELKLPGGVTSLMVEGKSLPVPSANPQNIVIVGDTGCRMKGDTIQDCSGMGDGEPWRWAQIVATAAAQKPDLIIHVGDYLYREIPCPEGNKNCEGSPYGDTWATWDVDFFEPVGDLLSAAPWIFVRGNHEDCTRSWKGWFLLLDPLPLTSSSLTDCAEHPDPYLVGFKDFDVAVMDSAVVPNAYQDPPNQQLVDLFGAQLKQVNSMVANKAAWTATHRPFWGLSTYEDDGTVKLSAVDITLRAALEQIGGLAPTIEMALAGHIHQFELLRFQDARPIQVVAGAAGTELDPPLTKEVADANSTVFTTLGLKEGDYITEANFNFLVVRPDEKVWKITLIDYLGKVEGNYSSPRK